MKPEEIREFWKAVFMEWLKKNQPHKHCVDMADRAVEDLKLRFAD